MEKNNYLFTSEAVSHGHPDKICDQISDSILDAYLEQDSNSRVAIETLVTKNKIVVAGEISSSAKVNVKKVIRNTVKSIGYDRKEYGFWHKSKIYNFIHKQTPELQNNADTDNAGDQGIMFGYACRETDDYMPIASSLANYILYMIHYVDRNGYIKKRILYPDAKCQVTIEYCDGKPQKINNILLSVSHAKLISSDFCTYGSFWDDLKHMIRYYAKEFVKNNCSLYPELATEPFDIIINPAGNWNNFGPAADSGVTGRKIVIDAYGGCAPVGGGAFSGKDGTKVDRTAAYMARHIAKNIVHNGIADSCLVQFAYIIGKQFPISINVFCNNPKYPEKQIVEMIESNFNLSVSCMVTYLGMHDSNHAFNSVYCHFGLSATPMGDDDIRPWEKLIELMPNPVAKED